MVISYKLFDKIVFFDFTTNIAEDRKLGIQILVNFIRVTEFTVFKRPKVHEWLGSNGIWVHHISTQQPDLKRKRIDKSIFYRSNFIKIKYSPYYSITIFLFVKYMVTIFFLTE